MSPSFKIGIVNKLFKKSFGDYTNFMLDNVKYMEYTVFVKLFKELVDYTNFK